MEKDKQRSQKTKRRERAQRMQAEKRQTQNNKTKDCDSAEDDVPMKEKPKRPPPPNRRKKTNNTSSSNNSRNNHNNDTNSSNNASNAVSNSKESLYEEDIIDGFAIFSFTSYDDLENSLKQLKCGQVTLGIPTDGTKLPPKSTSEQTPVLNNHIAKPIPSSPVQSTQIRNNIPSPLIDHAKKGTTVSSKNAAEGSTAIVSPANRSKTPVPSSMSAVPVTPPDPVIENACTRNTDNIRDKPVVQQTSSPLRGQRASSHDRLSDISSRCSSGKGYMCDSEGDEGDDDKGSDGDCMLFPSPPSSCKRELPRTAIPNHLNSSLLNGNATDTSERRSPGSYPPPTSKPQIRVVTPPLKYSPKTIQQLQPINQAPPNSLPYPPLSQLNASNSHHKPIAGPADQHVPPASLQHHYTVPTSQTQSPYTPSQQPLPLTHPQFPASAPHYPPVINGGLPPAPPQAHSGGHPAHMGHPLYAAHTPHHVMAGSASPLSTASVPNSIPSTTVPQLSPSPSTIPYATSAPSNASSSYATPPQLCPLQLSVSSGYTPQPPAAHSANVYASPYAPHSQTPSHIPYSTHAPTPPILQPSVPSQNSFAPHPSNSSHLPNSHHPANSAHGVPNSHIPNSHHMAHLPPQISSAYNHVSQIPPAYSNIPYGSTANSSVTSENSTVVVAAPSSYATPPHTAASNFSSLYAPYSNTPYLPSHSRASRSPLPVISAKSTVSNISASITTCSMSIPSATPASVATTTVTTSHRDYATTPTVNRSHSPRGHSPTRERDSYSSNVSSLSRGSVQTPISNSSPFNMPSVPVPAPSAHAAMPVSVPVPPSVPVSSSLNLSNKPIWGPLGNSTTTSPAAVAATIPTSIPRPHNSFAPPLFTPATSTSSAHPSVPAVAAPPPAVPPLHSNPSHPANPFSAESLFQSNEQDLLRRELDSRFLATQERSLVAAGGGPPPYLRTEMHHHQHQHTHVHQHTAPLLPPPAAAALYPPPLQFKDIPKLGGVDSSFYRQTLGITNYPGYPSALLHPTLGAATPFAPPTHLPTFTPKQVVDPTKSKPMVKTGKWNAMHVRIAWEIYHHQQQKQPAADIKPSKNELLNRTPSHLFQTPPRTDLSSYTTPHRPPGTAFEPHAHPTASPYSALGNSVFSRYPPGPFPTLTQYPGTLHDPWARLQARTIPNLSATPYPSQMPPAWNIKPEPNESERERERERERDREREREREREKEKERSKERDRIRREEKQRRLIAQQQQQQQAAQAAQQAKTVLRERSPLRDTPSTIAQKEEEILLLGRPPPTYLPRHTARTLPPPHQFTPWDHYRYDPLRYNPLMAAIREEEEQRAKLFGAYPGAPPPATHLRKEATPSALHGRSDLHLKKDDSSQSR